WPRPPKRARRSANNGLDAKTPRREGRRGLPRRSFFLPIPAGMRRKPSLRTELLFNLAFLATAALLLGVGTILIVQVVAPDLTLPQAFPLVLAIILLDVGVFIVFGRYLVTRHVLRPVGQIGAAAEAVAAGDLAAR